MAGPVDAVTARIREMRTRYLLNADYDKRDEFLPKDNFLESPLGKMYAQVNAAAPAGDIKTAVTALEDHIKNQENRLFQGLGLSSTNWNNGFTALDTAITTAKALPGADGAALDALKAQVDTLKTTTLNEHLQHLDAHLARQTQSAIQQMPVNKLIKQYGSEADAEKHTHHKLTGDEEANFRKGLPVQPAAGTDAAIQPANPDGLKQAQGDGIYHKAGSNYYVELRGTASGSPSVSMHYIAPQTSKLRDLVNAATDIAWLFTAGPVFTVINPIQAAVSTVTEMMGIVNKKLPESDENLGKPIIPFPKRYSWWSDNDKQKESIKEQMDFFGDMLDAKSMTLSFDNMDKVTKRHLEFAFDVLLQAEARAGFDGRAQMRDPKTPLKITNVAAAIQLNLDAGAEKLLASVATGGVIPARIAQLMKESINPITDKPYERKEFAQFYFDRMKNLNRAIANGRAEFEQSMSPDKNQDFENAVARNKSATAAAQPAAAAANPLGDLAPAGGAAPNEEVEVAVQQRAASAPDEEEEMHEIAGLGADNSVDVAVEMTPLKKKEEVSDEKAEDAKEEEEVDYKPLFDRMARR